MTATRTLSASDVERVAKRHHIDLWHENFALDEFRAGMNAEIERRGGPPVTEEQCSQIARTVLENLRKVPQYYHPEVEKIRAKARDGFPTEFGPAGDRPDW
jgi:hypothetical protein